MIAFIIYRLNKTTYLFPILTGQPKKRIKHIDSLLVQSIKDYKILQEEPSEKWKFLFTTNSINQPHLKDLRATGFEPIYKPSGYFWNRSNSYYFETKDAETNFFIDELPAGTYISEYQVKDNHIGQFSTGITQAESMYNTNDQIHSKSTTLQFIP